MTGHWQDRAACAGADPALFSPTGSKSERKHKARAVIAEYCRHCEVAAECLTDALNRERGKGVGSMEGVRGGFDHIDRARLLRAERTQSPSPAKEPTP